MILAVYIKTMCNLLVNYATRVIDVDGIDFTFRVCSDYNDDLNQYQSRILVLEYGCVVIGCLSKEVDKNDDRLLATPAIMAEEDAEYSSEGWYYGQQGRTLAENHLSQLEDFQLIDLAKTWRNK